MNEYSESKSITIRRNDEYLTSTTTIRLCDVCYKEFIKIYLNKNI